VRMVIFGGEPEKVNDFIMMEEEEEEEEVELDNEGGKPWEARSEKFVEFLERIMVMVGLPRFRSMRVCRAPFIFTEV